MKKVKTLPKKHDTLIQTVDVLNGYNQYILEGTKGTRYLMIEHVDEDVKIWRMDEDDMNLWIRGQIRKAESAENGDYYIHFFYWLPCYQILLNAGYSRESRDYYTKKYFVTFREDKV